MRVSTLKDEKKLSDLVGRLYEIKGPGAEARKQRATDALLELNPHLADLKNARPGIPLIVPDLEGVKHTEEAPPAGADLKARFDELRPVLGKAREALNTAAARSANQAKDQLKAIRSGKLKTLAKKDSSVREHLSRLTEEVQARAREAEEFKDIQKQALGQMEKDLGELSQALAQVLSGITVAPPLAAVMMTQESPAPTASASSPGKAGPKKRAASTKRSVK